MFHWSGADPHRWVWPVACPAVVAQAESPELAVDWVVRFRAPPADHPLGVLMSRTGTAGNPVALIDYQDSGRLVAVAVAVAGTARSTLYCDAPLCGRAVEPVPAHRRQWPAHTAWPEPDYCRDCISYRVFVVRQTPGQRLHIGLLDRGRCLSSPGFRRAPLLHRNGLLGKLAGHADPVCSKGFAIQKLRFAGEISPSLEIESERHPADTTIRPKESLPALANSPHPATG